MWSNLDSFLASEINSIGIGGAQTTALIGFEALHLLCVFLELGNTQLGCSNRQNCQRN
jgi:hypothetical protein